ncbi:MAG: Ca-activated chloride channel family protein [Flavobacteriales bacterium]|jgi:tetratricopeptide (TPR) repeat protein
MMNLGTYVSTTQLSSWKVSICLLFISILSMSSLSAQDKSKGPKINPNALEARNLIIEGTEVMSQQEGVVDVTAFAKAESNLRKAISLDPASVPAKYNAGTNYYKNKKWEESTASLLYATEVAKTKTEKHKSFHNLGNALYQRKNYKGAVEAYKNALRNNPTDEETRYNLQLAKKEEEKDGGGGGGGDDDKEKEDQDKKDQEKNEKDKKGDGEEKESDDGKEKETDDEGKEKEDEGEQKEDENGKPDDKEDQQDGGEGDEKKEQPQKPTPKQGQLSPQRVQSLLKAMQDQEQKTQEKINAQKTKGAKVKTEKDW